MVVLGNSILGLLFGKYGLKLTKDGLYKRIKNEDNTYRTDIFLTKDIRVILELIEVDFDESEFNDMNLDEFLEFIIDNKYFSIDYNKNANNGKFINLLTEYLHRNPKTSETIPLRTERVSQILNINLRSIIDYNRLILNSYDRNRTKWSEVKSTLISDGYNVRNFQKDITKFKKSMSDYEHKKMYFELSVDEIVVKFLSMTDGNINTK